MGMKFKTVKISFYLKYQTHFGQSIWVFGNHPSLGGGQPQKALPLSYLNDNFWVLELNFPFTDQKIEYHYLIREENGKELVEWGNDKILDLSLGITKDLILLDTWNFEGQVENVFYTDNEQGSYFLHMINLDVQKSDAVTINVTDLRKKA